VFGVGDSLYENNYNVVSKKSVEWIRAMDGKMVRFVLLRFFVFCALARVAPSFGVLVLRVPPLGESIQLRT
jgi:hypothetical protein